MEWRVAGCEGVDERGEKTHLEKPVKACCVLWNCYIKLSKNVQLPELIIVFIALQSAKTTVSLSKTK